MIVYENIFCKRTDRVIGRGNSIEVSEDEAKQLVKAGTHRAESPSELTIKPIEDLPQEDIIKEKEGNGDYNNR